MEDTTARPTDRDPGHGQRDRHAHHGHAHDQHGHGHGHHAHDRHGQGQGNDHHGHGHHDGAGTSAGWFALALLCIAQFMLVLDVTVVNLALPEIAVGLGASASAVTWAVTAYVIPFGGLLLLGGKLSDAFGARRLFLIGLATFTAASVLAGLAPTLPVLIAARVLQGVGAAMLSPAALANVMTLFTGRRRYRALAVWGGLAGAGSAAGVLLGGLLASGPGWRWIFLINLPVGAFVAVLVPFVVRADDRARRSRTLDVAGAVLITGAVAALVAGITWLTADGMTWVGVVAIASAATLGVAFWAHERRHAVPLIPLAVLARRQVQAGVWAMLAATALMIGMFYLLSFLLQAIHGWEAVAAGVAFLPIALGTVVGAQIGGRLIPRVGGRIVGIVSFLLVGAGAGATAAFVEQPILLVTAAAVASVGIGAAFVSATTAAFTGVGHHETGVVSGIVNTAHELGGALGIAVLASVAALGATGETTGYLWAFLVAAAVAVLGAVSGAVLMPRGIPSPDAPAFVH